MRYNQRGVSAKKEDVHNALKKVDKGLFPGAFCKIVPDFLGGDEEYCNIMHADGAGTKSSLAYLYYRETGDLSVFKGIAMDSIVMNTDDLLCAGSAERYLLSSTIGRNQKHIPGEVIKTLIEANEEIAQWFTDQGIPVLLTGGETADVGDLVRTLIVDTTVTARLKRSEVITNKQIKPGMVIVGLSSSGKSHYEDEYNSGIGSNGLTSARHDVFHKSYATKYPESFSPEIPSELVYCGQYKVTDSHPDLPITVGKAVLSPTRTYAPVIAPVLQEYREKIGGIIHCSGGAQTKCLKFGKNIHYIKDSLFETPPVFKIIQQESGTETREMYRVFNMGHRMEIYTDQKSADGIISIAQSKGVDAKVVGHLEESAGGNRLTIENDNKKWEYTD